MKIDLALDDRDLRAALSEAIRRGQDLTPAMRSIGEALVNSTRERFRDEEAPDGSRWAELSDVTKKRREHPGENILTQEGFLGGSSIHSDAGPDWVEVGSASVKANVLHFGAKAGEFGGVRTALPGRNFFQKIPWGGHPREAVRRAVGRRRGHRAAGDPGLYRGAVDVTIVP